MSTEEINELSDKKMSTSITTNTHKYDEDQTNTKEICILARTSKEKSSYRNLQLSLNQLNIVIRRIKNTNVLCIYPEEQWIQKINTYMKQNNVFQRIGSMDFETSDDDDPVQQTLIIMSNLVVKTLHTLFLREAITTKQYENTMYYNQTIIQIVNKLFFIPEIRQNKISIQPAAICYNEEPIQAIVTFIHKLLHPLIDRIVHSNFTFSEGHHTIKTVEKYTQQGLLRPTTLFVKVVIHDLCTALSHDLLIEALAKFLRLYVESKQIEEVSITTIVQLVELILKNQFYVYDNQLYRQTSGGSNSSPLINGLVDIYLYNLTHILYSKLLDKNEVVGRWFNQIFFTWNESKDDLFNLLNGLNFTHPEYIPTPITILINDKIEYLGAEICHQDGKLQTRVYHDFYLEPYTLSYPFDTRMLKGNNDNLLLYTVLERALRFCSNVDEFENERLFIELSYIINDTSMNLIEKGVDDFLIHCELFMKDTCIDKKTYHNRRQNIQNTKLLSNMSHLYEKERKQLQYNEKYNRRHY